MDRLDINKTIFSLEVPTQLLLLDAFGSIFMNADDTIIKLNDNIIPGITRQRPQWSDALIHNSPFNDINEVAVAARALSKPEWTKRLRPRSR